MFKVIEKKDKNGSTFFCTQYNHSEWYCRMANSPQTEALLDRVFNCSEKVDCGSFNMREHDAKLKE